MTSYTIEYASAPARYTIEFAKGTGPQGPSGGGAGGGGSLTIREVDGSPSVIATELVFQPSRLAVAGTVATVLAANTILSGSGAPADSLGVDGDFYFDEFDAHFYGPKSGGVWADEYVIMNGSPGANAQVTSPSSSSVSIGSGSRTFTIPTAANRGWVIGMRLRAAFDGSNYVEGPITSLTATSVTINVDNALGSGTRTSWAIGIAGDRGATGGTGETGPQGPAGATGAAGPNSVSSSTATTLTGLLIGDGSLVGVATIGAGLTLAAGQLATTGVVLTTTPQSVEGVKTFTDSLDLAPEALADAATITVDAAAANKFDVTLGGNRTIANPTNPIDGRVIIFRLRQDAQGSRVVNWANDYRFRGDLAAANVTLSTSPTVVDRVAFEYVGADSKWDCISFIKGS